MLPAGESRNCMGGNHALHFRGQVFGFVFVAHRTAERDQGAVVAHQLDVIVRSPGSAALPCGNGGLNPGNIFSGNPLPTSCAQEAAPHLYLLRSHDHRRGPQP